MAAKDTTQHQFKMLKVSCPMLTSLKILVINTPVSVTLVTSWSQFRTLIVKFFVDFTGWWVEIRFL